MFDIEFILGTAQFSGNYGITNNFHKFSKKELFSILHSALDNGITKLDTASSYPNVHKYLATTLSMSDLFRGMSIATKLDFQDKSFEETKNFILGFHQLFPFNRIDVIFAHDWDRLGEKGYKTIQTISEFFPQIRFGASIYDVSSIESIMRMRPYISVVQLPLNILNQTFLSTIPMLQSLGFDLWVRSAFLQGAIDWTSPNNRFRNHEDVQKLRELGLRIGASPFSLALDFLKGICSTVIVGVISKNQLIELLNLVREPKLHIDYEEFASIDSNLIDPRLW